MLSSLYLIFKKWGPPISQEARLTINQSQPNIKKYIHDMSLTLDKLAQIMSIGVFNFAKLSGLK